jgi:cytochrome c oxidase subunit 3
MAISLNNNQPPKGSVGMHSKKFMMLMAMVSMCMLFAALTSALIVKKADTTTWKNFVLPKVFMYSTFVILISSVLLQYSYSLYKKMNMTYKWVMVGALLSATIFGLMQYNGWMELTKIGAPLSGNVSGSFVYIVTGFHLAHLVGGMVVLLITTIRHSLRQNPDLKVKNIADVEIKVNYEVLLIFWHFLGALWVYLYLFLFIIYN